MFLTILGLMVLLMFLMMLGLMVLLVGAGLLGSTLGQSAWDYPYSQEARAGRSDYRGRGCWAPPSGSQPGTIHTVKKLEPDDQIIEGGVAGLHPRAVSLGLSIQSRS